MGQNCYGPKYPVTGRPYGIHIGMFCGAFKAVVSDLVGLMAQPLFLPEMVLAGPSFWPNMILAGPFSHASSRLSLMIYFL